MIDEKLVSVQKHPEADLFIYNYTPKVQYKKLWNEITRQTRGLILDPDLNIVARPFEKFFNLEEHSSGEIPNEPFNVFEKLDGSLGILYWYNNKPHIATRGSFESDQAKHATRIMHTRYAHLSPLLNRSKTYLFEIIYPENRIVVDYGLLDDIVLLTVIDNETGKETIENIGFPIVKRYPGHANIHDLKLKQETNKEGFVIRFKNGFRVKVKFEEYVRLHRILTGVSNIAIWEYLRDGRSFDELLEKVPDEFYDWLTETRSTLERRYTDIYNEAEVFLRTHNSKNRKEFALRVMDKAPHISGVIFNLYNNKDVPSVIWKMIRPPYSKPFKKDE